LNYINISQGVDITDETYLTLHEITPYYEPPRTGIHGVFEKSIGLRHHPAIILKIARAKVLPKSGFKDGSVGWHRNFVKHVMNNTRMDVVALIMSELQRKKTDFESNINYAPYIMSLILDKTKFKGPCDVKHTLYRLYKNAPELLNCPLTEYLEEDRHPQDAPDINDDEEEAQDDYEDNEDYEGEAPQQPPPVQPQWEPPAGYFDSYFASLQQSMTTQIQQVQTGFTRHFQAYGQQVNNNFEAMQASSKVFKLNLTHASPTLKMPCTTTCITQ
jgi:ABC-type cobalt transport system substrate-binding protein